MAKETAQVKETVSIKDFSFDGGTSLLDGFGGKATPIKQDLGVLDEDDEEEIKTTNLEEDGEAIEEKEVTEEDFNFDNKPKKVTGGKAPVQMTGETTEEEVVEPKKKEAEKKKPETVQTVEEDDEEDDEAEVINDEPTPVVDEKLLFTSLAQGLKEKGVFKHIEIAENAELTEEEYIELHEMELDARVDDTIETLFKGLSDTGKDFIKHIKAGGSESDFMQGYVSEVDLSSIDTENEEERKRLLTYYMTAVDEMDAEEVQDRLDWLKNNGKDKTTADKYLKALQAADKKRKEDFKAAKVLADKKSADSIKAFNDSIKSTIEEVDAIGAFSITKEDKKKLPDLITKATIKVDNGKYAPPFQVKLSKVLKAKTVKDKQNLILLAKLIDSDFDVSDLIPQVETKVIKKAKSILDKVKSGNLKVGTAGSYNKKTLADYFD